MRKWTAAIGLAMLLIFSGGHVLAQDAALTNDQMPDELKAAIEQSLKDEKMGDQTKAAIDKGKKARGDRTGYLGIPGAPAPSFIVGLLWAIWVGWIFSTVGAFGGIMAGVGHITIFGLGDYAKTFGKGNPINALITDSIRVSNQWLVGTSALISVTNYYRMGRLVAPLGICLAIGGVGGSWIIPALTAGKISLKDYLGYFGLVVLLLGVMLLRETTAAGQEKKKKAKEAAAAFEKKKAAATSGEGVKVTQGSWALMLVALAVVILSAIVFQQLPGMIWLAYVLALVGWIITFFMGTIKFTFYGVEFEFKAFIPMLGGIFIAALASFLGIGGGFLFVPFLTSVAGLPMFLVAGTSGLAVLVGMIASIFAYMGGKGVVVQWSLVGGELIGIFIGSMIGPRTSKYIPDKWLKIIFIILAFYVGIRYTTKGFLGYSIVPPF